VAKLNAVQIAARFARGRHHIRSSPVVELLEGRSLLATVVEYPLPAGVSIDGVTWGPGGNLWFAEPGFPDASTGFVGSGIGMFNPATRAVTNFPVSAPTADPYEVPSRVTVGPDGNLWFTESDETNAEGQLGELDATTHAVSLFPAISPSSPYLLATDIISGPDASLWFTSTGDAIGQIDPDTKAITPYALPAGFGEGGFALTVGPDNNVWFIQYTAGGPETIAIGMLNSVTHAISEYPLTSATSQLLDICAGPDGNLWFTDPVTDAIGKLNPTTHAITEFPLPSGDTGPNAITTGPDGNIWFTENYKIGMINPATDAITDFPVPPADSEPDQITVGADGNIWFSEDVANQIGEVVLNTAQATTTMLAALANPVIARQPVSVVVKVSADAGAASPTGSVSLEDGSTVVGTGTLGSNGEATIVVDLAAGSYQLSAVYAGNASFRMSSSSAVDVQVVAPPAVISIAPAMTKQGITSFAVSYSEPVNSSSATGSSLYHVFGAVTKVVKRHRETVYTKRLAIRSISLGASGTRVTIKLAKAFKGKVEVEIDGMVTASNGAPGDVNTSMFFK
jgi:streptogramin lyase